MLKKFNMQTESREGRKKMKRKQTTNSGKVEGIIHESPDGGQPFQRLVLWRNSEDKSPSKANHEAWRLVKLCSTPSTLTNC